MRLRLPLIVLTLAALVVVALPALGGHSTTEPWYYYYFKQRVDLTVSEDFIAIGGADRAELERSLAENGLTEFGVQEELLPGLWLFARPNVSATVRVEPPLPMEEVMERVAAAVGFVSPTVFGPQAELGWITDTLAVRFSPEIAPADAERELDRIGEVLERDFLRIPREYLLRPTGESARDVIRAANALALSEHVEFAHPVMLSRVQPSGQTIPNDPAFLAYSWGLHNTGQKNPLLPDLDVNAPEGWFAGGIGSSQIVVLVMDNGVDPTHPDLTFTHGKDFTPYNPTGGGAAINLCDNHGTWVASVIAEAFNNLEGTSGVSPGTTLASARIAGQLNPPTSYPCSPPGFNIEGIWIANALTWANADIDPGPAAVRARVTNLSWNSFFQEATLDAAYQLTKDAGMIHFVSAGNNSSPSGVRYPANLSSVNAVTNLDFAGSSPRLNSTSNYGPGTDFTAPGTDILMADRSGMDGLCPSYPAYCPLGDDYFVYSGTSFASPLVAGVAALVLSRNPTLDPATVEWILARSAIVGGGDLGSTGWDVSFGWGIPRLDVAVDLAAHVNTGLLFYDGFEAGALYWSSSTP